MEDRFKVVQNLFGDTSEQFAYFGIFDGHSGCEAAEFVQKHLHLNLAGTYLSSRSRDVTALLREAYAATDSLLLEEMKSLRCASGTTGVTLLLSDNSIYVANVGDCRAVLSRAGKAIELTLDHKPTSAEEKSRIESEGGYVEFDRLAGHLSVSRAFGGFDQSTVQKLRGLSSFPDTKKFYITDEDEFLIAACDGLWDVIDSQRAVRFVSDCLKKSPDVSIAADKLVDEALRKYSEDNITVIIIGLERIDPVSGKKTIVMSQSSKAKSWEHGTSATPPSLSRSSTEESMRPRPRLALSGIHKLAEALKRAQD
jgi:protein phosphatase 2C family protein 2/3